MQIDQVEVNTPCTSVVSTRDLVRNTILNWLRTEAKMPIASLGDDETIVGLGIDSLGVVSIIDEIEKKTSKRLNLEVVFAMETVAELAGYIDSLPIAPRLDQEQAPAPMPAAEKAATLPATTNPLEHYERMNRRIHQLKDAGHYFFEPVIEEHDGAWVKIGGKRMLMLGSYEYLGLLDHPHLKESAIAAVKEFGTGHHGVRLLTGTTTLHRKLEHKIADFMRADDAIAYSSGFITNWTTVSTLVDENCCVIGDQWNHASIVDGCKASGAQFMIFEHNNIDSLAEKLELARGRRTLVVVDAVFSMDGDIIDLPAVVDLCKKHGALLMVDEAHSLGVLGKTGRGIQEHFGLADDDIDVKMGTLSKSLAGCGGFVAGKQELITYLKHNARGFIFSAALTPAQTGAAIGALETIEREPQIVTRLHENVEYYLTGLRSLGFDIGKSVTAIVPVMTKNEQITLEMTHYCRERGLMVVPVAFPAVPLNAPRLRTCVSALYTREELDFALRTLAEAGRMSGLIS
jgi:8-amino-7-oxononanoate synthase